MNFSASDLIKKSAAQLLYIRLNNISRFPTQQQLEGNTYAQIITDKLGASAEKRGIFSIEDINIYFCIDLVKDNTFAEIKHVIGKYEDWYLQGSIMQATLYASLLSKVNTLDTPDFRIREGYKQEVISVPKRYNYELWFGDEVYKVKPNKAILEHYINKAKLIKNSIETLNYRACREFDKEYKFKEFQILKPYYKHVGSNISLQQRSRTSTRV